MNRVEILRMSIMYFPTLFDLDHCKPNIPEKTSASVKHILPNVECHRRTVLERRKRLGGYRILLPTSTFLSLSLSVSTPVRPSHISILQRQHEPPAGAGNADENPNPRRCRTSRSPFMGRKSWSNIQTDDMICNCWQTTTKRPPGRSGTSFDDIVGFHYPILKHAGSRRDALDTSW